VPKYHRLLLRGHPIGCAESMLDLNGGECWLGIIDSTQTRVIYFTSSSLNHL